MLVIKNPEADTKITVGKSSDMINIQFKDKDRLGYDCFRPSFSEGSLYFTPVPEDVGKKIKPDGSLSFHAEGALMKYVDFIGEYKLQRDEACDRWYVTKAAKLDVTASENTKDIATSENTESQPSNRLVLYRPYQSLLTADESDLDETEKARLARIKAIPDTVRKLTEEEITRLREIVKETEAKIDSLCDYLNGEVRS